MLKHRLFCAKRAETNHHCWFKQVLRREELRREEKRNVEERRGQEKRGEKEISGEGVKR